MDSASGTPLSRRDLLKNAGVAVALPFASSSPAAAARTLEGRVALVTGSGRNLGRATVLELARRGAHVVVNGRSNQAEVDAVAAEARALGVRAIGVLADVGDRGQVERMAERALAEFGRVDILINNAGYRGTVPITEMTVEQWRAAMAVNADGPFHCVQAVVPGMIANRWGRIITVSGNNSYHGQRNWAHVCASKMGAVGLTRALAVELAPHNILVNHVIPGQWDTSEEAAANRTAAPAPSVPLGRRGLPPELANVYAFLSSDDASFITGQTIRVDGGELRL